MKIIEMFMQKDKVTIVTGGERGIGLSIATAFAEVGSHIVIAGIDEMSMATAKEKIEAHGVRCLTVKTDVTDEAAVHTMVKKVVNEFGHIDVLVNNAGSGRGGPAETLSLEDFEWVMKLNFTSQFIVSKAVGKVMLKQGNGSIINIASMSGSIVNNPESQCNYNSSKAGIIMLTKSLACEWAQRGVRVNCISPGYVKTPLTADRYLPEKSEMRDIWESLTPMGRMGEPEEIAGAALYLASDAASFTTGSNLYVDGGYTCW